MKPQPVEKILLQHLGGLLAFQSTATSQKSYHIHLTVEVKLT